MSFISWLRNPTRADLVQRPRVPAVSRQRPTFRPRLEAFEDRWMPSTLSVTNNLGFGAGSLRAEIAAAQNGDTIVFDKSLQAKTISVASNVPGNGFRTEIEINKSLNIQWLGAKHLAISGDLRRVFRVDQGVQVTISGLTIENGGGVTGAYDPVPDDYEGGGIINYGTLTLTACTLSGNTAYGYPGLGGAIYNAGTLTLSACTVTGNSAQISGGGIYNAGTLTLSACTVTGNSTHSLGGGIFNSGTLTISGTTVSGNSAYYGGGLYNAGTLTLSGSTVEDNSAHYQGGGIYNASSGILRVLNNSTVTRNTATIAGADLFNLGIWSADSTSMIGKIGP
jgi:hypothetical protein